MIKFTKMEGCGNDYIYINGLEQKVMDMGDLAVKMSNRHFGVGSDGLVMILQSEKADFTMRMFNPDGSESEMCGNAIRCVGKYVYDRGLTSKTTVAVDTLAGIKILELYLKDGVVDTVTVDMGEPVLKADLIPVKSNTVPICREKINIMDKDFMFTCVSMGNPHAVTYVDDINSFEVEKYGRVAETYKLFPNRTNVEFVEILNKNHVKLRVWERGTGETLACGTGACATGVAAILDGFCDRNVDIELAGGILKITWDKNNNHVYMTGPARFSFDGVWLK